LIMYNNFCRVKFAANFMVVWLSVITTISYCFMFDWYQSFETCRLQSRQKLLWACSFSSKPNELARKVSRYVYNNKYNPN
jgi:hypothetical protein